MMPTCATSKQVAQIGWRRWRIRPGFLQFAPPAQTASNQQMKETTGTYGFAPLRHLRHFLIGRGKGGALAHHHLSRTRSTTLRRHTAGWRLRLADHALARKPDRQTQRGTDHAKSFKVDSVEKGCIALVIGMRVLRAPIGGISTQQQHRGFHANALVEYQAHNRSWTIARSAARVSQRVFLLARMWTAKTQTRTSECHRRIGALSALKDNGAETLSASDALFC
jgi:hypothetical protein